MTAYEIYQTINGLSQPEFYDIAIQLNEPEIASQLIQNYFNCTNETAYEVINIFNKTLEENMRRKGKKPLPREKRAANNAAAARALQNVPTCPICQSTNLKKISGLSKVGSIALWGVFAAGRTSKTWHCNHCGSEW